jgi:medium-chain acyl-[acyl-carrier-protein] hydrolase
MAGEIWLSRQRTRSAPARLRLFCLPYAGGGAQIYRTYSQALPADVEVCAILLPGREKRFLERSLESVDAIVDQLAPVIARAGDLPYAIFGHSLGALVGFELLRRLRNEGQALPFRLFASGHRAPHLPDPDPPIRHLPDAEFIRELRQLNGTPQAAFESPELLELVLPMLRADFTAAETYVYRSEAPLPCSITALGGASDGMVTREALQAWKQHTSGDFEYHVLEGDHFFIHQRHEEVMGILRGHIAAALDGMGAGAGRMPPAGPAQ